MRKYAITNKRDMEKCLKILESRSGLISAGYEDRLLFISSVEGTEKIENLINNVDYLINCIEEKRDIFQALGCVKRNLSKIKNGEIR